MVLSFQLFLVFLIFSVFFWYFLLFYITAGSTSLPLGVYVFLWKPLFFSVCMCLVRCCGTECSWCIQWLLVNLPMREQTGRGIGYYVATEKKFQQAEWIFYRALGEGEGGYVGASNKSWDCPSMGTAVFILLLSRKNWFQVGLEESGGGGGFLVRVSNRETARWSARLFFPCCLAQGSWLDIDLENGVKFDR